MTQRQLWNKLARAKTQTQQGGDPRSISSAGHFNKSDSCRRLGGLNCYFAARGNDGADVLVFLNAGSGFPDSSGPSGKDKDGDCGNAPTDSRGFLPTL